MAISESMLTTEWVNPVRFPDGKNVNLRTVQAAIKNACDEAGIPIAFGDEQLKSGGLFNKQVEDVLRMYNPDHASDYLRFVIRVQHMGNYAFMHVYNMGGSKNFGADNRAGAGGLTGGFQKALNFVGGHNAKLQAEEQYYQILQDCLENILD